MTRTIALIALCAAAAGCGTERSASTSAEVGSLSEWALPVVDVPYPLCGVSSLCVDPKGRIWIGTRGGGVTRFDPAADTWSTFTSKDGLASDDVQSMASDGQGRVWCGTDSSGLSRFDPVDNSWRTFAAGAGLANDDVRAIAIDQKGRVWCGTNGGGVSCHDPMDDSWRTYTINNGLASDDVQALAVDVHGRVWCGSYSNFVSWYDAEDDSWRTLVMQDAGETANILAVAIDGKGRVWCGTDRAGLSSYDPSNATWRTYPTHDRIESDSIVSVTIDTEGRVWCGTIRGGVSCYGPADDSWRTYTARDGLAGNGAWALTVDTRGRVWCGTSRAGVSCYDAANDRWRTFAAMDGLVSDRVQALAIDAQGRVWCGTSGGGVCRYDQDHDGWRTFGSRDGLASDTVQSLAIDAEGRVWCGTFGGGMSSYNPFDDSWRTFTTEDGLASNDVQALAVDAAGRVWCGTDAGVSRYDPADDRWQTWKPNDVPAGNNVLALAVDLKGRIWCGAFRGGVSRYDPVENNWRTYSEDDGLPSASVRAFAIDDRGGIWCCPAGSALSRYDPTNDKWHTIRSKVELPGLFMQALAIDIMGRVWCGMYKGGIVRYDPADDSWRLITAKDGLLGDDVQTLRIDAHGKVWCGTYRGGVSRIDPAGGSIVGIGSSADFQPCIETVAPALNRPGGACLLNSSAGQRPVFAAYPPGAMAHVLASGPSGAVWMGNRLGGLVLADRSSVQQVSQRDGLPDSAVTCLGVVPGTNGKRVWVGTAGGPALVEGQRSAISPVSSLWPFVAPVTDADSGPKVIPDAQQAEWDGRPAGPVDAIAVTGEGVVYFAFNQRPGHLFDKPESAQGREQTSLWRVDQRGRATRLAPSSGASPDLSASTVRSLAWSERFGLWVGTSAGLFRSESGSHELKLYTGDGRLPVAPVREVLVAPDEHETVLFSTDKQQDVAPAVIGFRPGDDWSYRWDQSTGIPGGDVIDDIALNDAGELVVLVGSRLVKGAAIVPVPTSHRWQLWTLPILVAIVMGALVVAAVRYHPLVVQASAHPEQLRDWPLAKIERALTRLRRARLLQDVWRSLDLPQQRIAAVQRLASPDTETQDRITELAGLLGARDFDPKQIRVQLLTGGTAFVSPLSLPVPHAFADRTIAIVSLDGDPVNMEPDQCREVLQSALREIGQPIELPVLQLEHKAVSQACFPDAFTYLRLSEPELRLLMFSRSPQATFTGLLHTRSQLTVSPYSTAGETAEDMFFGRESELNELMVAARRQHIIVGPRRIGKTSLLKRLETKLREARPGIQLVSMSLLGVNDADQASRQLARAMERKTPADTSDEPKFLRLIREWCDETAGAEHVILIDEADALVEHDSSRGFPIMAALRNLQEQGWCAFIMTGYLYLYRQTLDQRSPLYNFAHVKRLGPLTPAAAEALATEPMSRLGVTYADRTMPARIVEATGGYPSFLQIVCGAILEQMKGQAVDLTQEGAHNHELLTVSEKILSDAIASSSVWDTIFEIFQMNASRVGQLICYLVVDDDEFTDDMAGDRLRTLVHPRKVPLSVIEGVMLQLKLFAFDSSGGQIRWAIPILREILKQRDPPRQIELLLSEMPRDASAWK